MKKKISPCKYCGKETYNETVEWSGYCSKKCADLDSIDYDGK